MRQFANLGTTDSWDPVFGGGTILLLQDVYLTALQTRGQ